MPGNEGHNTETNSGPEYGKAEKTVCGDKGKGGQQGAENGCFNFSWSTDPASQRLPIFGPSVPRNPLCPCNKPRCITKAGLSGFLYTSKDLIKTGEKLGAGDTKMNNPEEK